MSLLVDACRGNETDRTPIWIMRQAGRHLPEYLVLRQKHGFHTMMSQPDLITEITLQPVSRYDMDGAILYSDILVIPEAM
ncbi:uroporphyrinogen decarboxylase, partial [Caldithrix abyssi]|nr:uroporphyrinogen decarboxylase [Caldithrix abyssi]